MESKPFIGEKHPIKREVCDHEAGGASNFSRPLAEPRPTGAVDIKLPRFQDYLRDVGWLVNGGSGHKNKTLTHLLLDGGKVSVPDGLEGIFMQQYIIAVQKSRLGQAIAPSVVELRTKTFKLFVDFDFMVDESREAEELDMMHDIFSHANQVAKMVFQEPAPVMIVCSTARKGQKLGYHLIWTNILVQTDGALAFRQVLVDRLQSKFPEKWDFKSIVDPAVYKGSGLRMIFSAKGNLDGRFYEPSHSVNALGVVTVLPPAKGISAMKEWVQTLSIRTPHGSEPTAIHEEAAPFVQAASLQSGGGAKSLATATRGMEQYARALEAVSTIIPPQFHPMNFTGVVEMPHYFALRTSSQYCLNLRRPHKSNTVWFQLDRKGLRQRCFCRCDTLDGRVSGMKCSEFAGESWPLPAWVIDAFFADKQVFEFVEDGSELESDEKKAGGKTASVTRLASLPSKRSADSLSSLHDLLGRSRTTFKKKFQRRN